jgi:tetratricopeptide (TPR) repeat protein
MNPARPLFLVLWAFSFLGTAFAAGAPEVADLMQRGVAAYREDRLADSMTDFSEVLWLDPGNAAARNYLWNIADRIQRDREGRRISDEELADALRLAEERLSRRRLAAKETLEQLKEAYGRSRQPQSPEQLLSSMEGVEKYIGADFDSSRDATRAETYFQEILKHLSSALARGDFVTPKDQLNAQGFLAYYGGRWEDAAVHWEKAHQEDLSDALILKNLDNVRGIVAKQQKDEKIQDLIRQAGAYQRAGEYEQAVLLWRDVVKLDPDNPEAPQALASGVEALQKERKKREVNRLFKQGLDLYRAEKRIDAAQVWLEALQIDPSQREIREWLKRVGEKLEKKEVVFIEREPARASTPHEVTAVSKKNAETLYADGLRMYAQGDVEKALNLWRRSLQEDPSMSKAKKALEHAEAEIKLRD